MVMVLEFFQMGASIPANITRIREQILGTKMCFWCRYLNSTTPIMTKTNSPKTVPVNLWEYSIMVWYSKGGISSPWHKGQSGQPNPDSDTRTNPPSDTCKNAVTSVIITSALSLKLFEILDFIDSKTKWLKGESDRNVRYLCVFH